MNVMGQAIPEFDTDIFSAASVRDARAVDDRLREIYDEVQPDVVVEDNVVAFAALQTSGRPWVRITSCNPLELKDPNLAPVFSGYPQDDRGGWDAFWAEYDRVGVVEFVNQKPQRQTGASAAAPPATAAAAASK